MRGLLGEVEKMGDDRSFSIARSSEDLGKYCWEREHAHTPNNSSIINRIMQNFRPIAPKPAAGGEAISKGKLPEKASNGRVKRKYLRVRKERQCKKKKGTPLIAAESAKKDGSSTRDQVVTLQLLPERSDDDKDSPKSVPRCASGCCKIHDLPTLIKSNNLIDEKLSDFNRSRAIETWIVVECVTETCMDGIIELLGLSDTDKINYLQVDKSPGFVSDSSNHVVWVNEAYKKMVSQLEDDEEHHQGPLMEFKVWLVMKENMPFRYPAAFACRVTYHYMRRGQKCSRTVPCDVWKMEFGGFAWRLDITAALGLAI